MLGAYRAAVVMVEPYLVDADRRMPPEYDVPALEHEHAVDPAADDAVGIADAVSERIVGRADRIHLHVLLDAVPRVRLVDHPSRCRRTPTPVLAEPAGHCNVIGVRVGIDAWPVRIGVARSHADEMAHRPARVVEAARIARVRDLRALRGRASVAGDRLVIAVRVVAVEISVASRETGQLLRVRRALLVGVERVVVAGLDFRRPVLIIES